MAAFETIAIWGVLAGAVFGLGLHMQAPQAARARTRRFFLRFGAIACIFGIGPLAMLTERHSDSVAAVAMGLIAFTSLVIGVVMEVLVRASNSDRTTKGTAGV